MVKTLIFANNKVEANKIIKNEEQKTITGYDDNNNILFEFRGINDFSKFKISNGDYDNKTDDITERLNDIEETLAKLLGGGNNE